MNTKLTIAAFLALGLAACNTSTPAPGGNTGGDNPGGGGGGPSANQPGVVQGTAVDRSGKPLKDALVWVLPAETTGLVTVRTGADGHYKTKVYPNIPYYTIGWLETTYRGKDLCLRLAPQNPEEIDAFVPESGVTHNFVWKTSGPIGRKGDGWFGGEIRPFFYGIARGDVIEYTLIPDGPLVDGSQGQTIVRKHDWSDEGYLWQDIPVGAYKVSAVRIEKDGSRTQLKVSTTGHGSDMAESTSLMFNSEGSCGGRGGNGLSRAFIYLQTPDYQD